MDRDELAKLTKRPAAGMAAVAVALSALLAGAPASVADPYDDDGGSSYSSDEGSVGAVDDGNSYDGGIGESESGGAGVEVDEPAGGGVEVGEPDGGGSGVDEPSGGVEVDEPRGGSGVDEPGGGGPADSEATSGGMDTGDSDGAGAVVGPDGGGVVEPAETEASPQEVAEASSTEAVTVTSTESTSEEITSYQSAIESTFTNSTYSTGTTLSSPVRAWNSSWISYDRFYRPVFTNPYPNPLQIVYDYGGRPRTFTVPPMQRAVIDVPQSGVYSFTGVTRPGSGPPASVSVGSFSGGGYQPAPGQAPPQKPNAPKPVKNAVVQVSYAAGESEPFRVRSLADLGKDPAMNGAEKVLLDGEVPAWGQWVKSPEDERLFQITETQLMPGVRQPSQDPLPGYEIQLVAAKSSGSWFERNKALVLGVAVGSGVVALIAAVTVLIRRRGAGAATG
jgi:hypothetical protein